MKINLNATRQLAILSYQAGEINVSLTGTSTTDMSQDPAFEDSTKIQTLTSSFVLSPTRIIEGWPINSIADLKPEHCQWILNEQPEIVLIGTGHTLTFPAPPVLQVFHKAGIGTEIMGTAAACRTFNILVTENRHVVAGLLML